MKYATIGKRQCHFNETSQHIEIRYMNGCFRKNDLDYFRPHRGIQPVPSDGTAKNARKMSGNKYITHQGDNLPGIGKILFERIAFPIHIPSAEVDCIPTRNPLFSLGL